MTVNLYNEISSNRYKSILLVFLFFLFAGFLGSIVGLFYGNILFGLIITGIFALIYSLIVFVSGADMVLAMTGAKEVQKKDYPHLYHTVEGLAIAAGIQKPRVFVIEDSALNAFATGTNPKNSAICVTTGLLGVLNRQELEGVIAHEMSHIKNNDIKVMMLAAVLTGVAVLISDFLLRSFLWGSGDRDRDNGNLGIILIVVGLVLAILSPIIAQMIQLAISRKREFLADASGAHMTRYPEGLASALEKIKKDPDPLVDNANRATAHLFISTPFRQKSSWFTNLFSTHPPIEERIKKLRSM